MKRHDKLVVSIEKLIADHPGMTIEGELRTAIVALLSSTHEIQCEMLELLKKMHAESTSGEL